MNFLGKCKNTLIGDKNFYSKVFSIVMPMIIQNTVTNVVNLLDNVMVGRVGTLQMSAVAIVNQLIFVFNLCIFGGLAGAGIFSTQYAGAKDNEGMRHCVRMKCYIGIFMLCIALGVFLAFPDFLIGSYLAEDTAPEAVIDTLYYAKSYLFVMLLGLFPFAVSQIYGSTLREVGETRFPMISSIIAIAVNLVFNYLLIFGKLGFAPLGVVGAAIATVLSRYVEMGIIIVFAHKNSQRFAFIKGVYRSFKVPTALFGKIMRSGMPLLINEFLWSLGMAVLLQCYSVRGLTVIAASNISNTAANLFNVAFISMGSAIAIMLGQALGAGDSEKAKNIVWKLMGLTVFVSAVMGLMLILVAGVIPNVYNTEPDVKALATKFLYVVAALMPFAAFAHGCYFTMRSGGRTIITFLFDSVVVWGLNIPVAWVLSNLTAMPIVYVFLVIQSLEIIKCILGFILVKKGVWIRNIVS
ncbi:MAG: MATE family efflux transporter [Acutalibacteraceae bacterium]|nr:MATE family efflux transporter [Acutalibacteraceae bacterium]